MKFIFLYEFSAALVYMGEMSTPTTHWRWDCGLNREFENFLSSLTTGHKSAVFSTKLKIFLVPLPIIEKAVLIELLSRKKEQKLFSVLSPHYRGNKGRFGENGAKK